MKKLLLFCLYSLLSLNLNASEKKSMEQLKWFEKFGCEKLIITQYENVASEKILKKISIEDKNYIRSLQGLINQLPTKGEIEKEMSSEADFLTLQFVCDGKDKVINFFDSKIQTPHSSFYSASHNPGSKIWEQISLHFKTAEVGKPAIMCKGLKISFKDFDVDFMGLEDRTPKNTTASSYVETFIITNHKDKSQIKIEITSGQLPPRPESFTLNGTSYIMSTFTSQDGKRLEGTNFIIEKKK